MPSLNREVQDGRFAAERNQQGPHVLPSCFSHVGEALRYSLELLLILLGNVQRQPHARTPLKDLERGFQLLAFSLLNNGHGRCECIDGKPLRLTLS